MFLDGGVRRCVLEVVCVRGVFRIETVGRGEGGAVPTFPSIVRARSNSPSRTSDSMLSPTLIFVSTIAVVEELDMVSQRTRRVLEKVQGSESKTIKTCVPGFPSEGRGARSLP